MGGLEVRVSKPSIPFAQELRHRRLDAGVTLAELGVRVHYSKGQLSKVERGVKAPSRDLARLCDAALEAGGALVALLPEPSTDARAEEPDGFDEEVWLMQLSTDGGSWFTPVPRRQVVSAGAASLMSLGAGDSEALSTPGGARVLEVSLRGPAFSGQSDCCRSTLRVGWCDTDSTLRPV
ncbi:helix-turn-helix transcriptional regulator, partial [Streptomyces sp. NPDC005355]|uniref:helix-turn-helix domain-containing protein n=1 Tax=Streptomyces sp. NPDC005355 TaxID=3157038 RepID=UPI0033A08BF4